MLVIASKDKNLLAFSSKKNTLSFCLFSLTYFSDGPGGRRPQFYCSVLNQPGLGGWCNAASGINCRMRRPKLFRLTSLSPSGPTV